MAGCGAGAGLSSWHGSARRGTVSQLLRWPRHHLHKAACLSIMEQGKLHPKCLSALLCAALMRPEVPARRRHKGCWKGGEEGMGSSERFQGEFTPHCPAQTPSARMRGQRQALTHTVGTIMPSQLGHA